MTEVEKAAPNCTLLIDIRQRMTPIEAFACRPPSAAAVFEGSIEAGQVNSGSDMFISSVSLFATEPESSTFQNLKNSDNDYGYIRNSYDA
jgi:hypothetical protein